ncbi:MAG: phage portal protein, partial [Allobaculum sp.]|nr:phage portal protein [Allobaculum sp.]
MKITEFFRRFGRSNKKKSCTTPMTGFPEEIARQIHIREAAFHACANLIASCVSKCELAVYKRNGSVKDKEWYRWNVQPNPNQCASAFWQKLIHRLYEDNEALIVPRDGELYVADSFIRDATYAFYPHTYSGIQIEGLNYEPVLKEDQVFYFALHDVSVKDLVDQVTGLYGQLMAAFITSYTESSGTRGVLHIEQIAEQSEDFEDRMKKLLQDDFKTFYKSPSAVLPLFEGYQYEELSHSTAPTTDTRDFHDQINDVFELYAVAFGIPKVLITGELQDTSQAIDSLLTFGLDPLLGLIEDELNRKLFSREKLLNGTYVKWRTNRIRHI